tara:strand:- start:1755 stop:2495 length:741 start_codon:yes stop_codon:yes gene_type:complete
MILRRVIAHVKNQEWTAIAIDFLIVVLGVFVATQVASWNETRKGKELEQQYLMRLHGEVSVLIEEQAGESRDAVLRAERLQEVTAYFNTYDQPGASPPDAIGPHCEAVIRSHIYAGDITLPTTISEMISTGQILLVSNDALKMQIVRFAQAMDVSSQLRHDVQVDRIVLSRKYPDWIRRSAAGRAENSCDFPAMAQSQAFVNDLVDNSERFRAFAALVMKRQQDLRQQLHELLDKELAISHEDPVP